MFNWWDFILGVGACVLAFYFYADLPPSARAGWFVVLFLYVWYKKDTAALSEKIVDLEIKNEGLKDDLAALQDELDACEALHSKQ